MSTNKKTLNHQSGSTIKASADQKTSASVAVVAIGASAGGLEALERFFKSTPTDSNLAFVVIQHLDPEHKSLLSELLQRYTLMPVNQVEDGVMVEANHIYVIPPSYYIAMHSGQLLLMEPTARRGMRLPIDYFFRSLAQEQGEQAIAIVLSGTGTDGTLGARAVKGEGGLVIAQEPASAAYNGMPSSIIATGLVDIIDTPEKLSERILAYLGRMFPVKKKQRVSAPIDDRLSKILLLMRSQTGHDFSQYKTATLIRRIERRMVINRVDSVEQYITFLGNNPNEITVLFHELLIGVTAFFRDLEAFEILQSSVIPSILKEKGSNGSVRVWVPACSTGEEAYSIAILIRHYLDENKLQIPVQIFATDIDNFAIETAREGIYPESISADIPENLLKNYFIRQGSSWQVKKSVREMVIYATQSVVKDPPFSSLDLISCRNLLIYFQTELQQQVLALFHYVLRLDGFLFLGSADSVTSYEAKFNSINKKWRIYQSQGIRKTPGNWHSDLPAGQSSSPRLKENKLEKESLRNSIRHITRQALLEDFAPVAIMIDADGKILYVQGRTGRFLEATSGELSLSLVELAREGLRPALIHALREAKGKSHEIFHETVRVQSEEGERFCNLWVRPILDPVSMRGLNLIVLEDLGPDLSTPEHGLPSTEEDKVRISRLEKELKDNRNYLQATIEELESTNEELTSTNEELQSANEEMQSGNEELETSQEELRSVNEELVTVNTELQTKLDQLDKANNDLSNLMTSTELAIVFLDINLCIQRFTPAATRLLHLIDADIGRPLVHTSSDLDYQDLVADVENMLDTLIPLEREITTRNGHWYLLRIRPYRTSENMIKGAVLTFVDIHEQKKGEELKRLTRVVEQSPVCVIITNYKGVIEYVNPRFIEVSGWDSQEVIGERPNILKSGEHSSKFYKSMWTDLRAGKVWRGNFHNRRKNGELFWSEAIISPICDSNGKITHFVGVQQDDTARHQMEEKLRSNEIRYRNLVEHMSSGVAVYQAINNGKDFVFLEFNKAAENIEHINRNKVIGNSLLKCFPGVKKFGLLDVLKRVWETGQPEHLPLNLYQDDRVKSWRDNYVYQLPGGELVTIYDDVSEVRQAELALQESEQLHRLTLDNISDVVCITDKQGNFTFVSPSARDIFGLTEEEIINNYTIEKLLGKHLFDSSELKNQGELKNIELLVTAKQGFKFDLQVTVKHVEIGKGIYLYTFHDISKRKKIEKLLEKGKERYELTIKLAGIGTWDWDIISGKLDWSETIEPMFGFSTGKFGATYEAFQECIHPDDRQYVMDAVNSAVTGGTKYHIKHRIVWPDGTHHQVSEKGGVLRDSNGKAVRMVGVVQLLD